VVIGVHRAALTLAGDAPDPCTPHRQALPQRLTIRCEAEIAQTLQAVRLARLAPIVQSRQISISLPYRLTSKKSWPHAAKKRRSRHPQGTRPPQPAWPPPRPAAAPWRAPGVRHGAKAPHPRATRSGRPCQRRRALPLRSGHPVSTGPPGHQKVIPLPAAHRIQSAQPKPHLLTPVKPHRSNL
jgi:hypothetical protein